MKIGIDARMYRSSVAGIGRYSQNLIKNLLEIDRDDEFVLFMTPEDKKEFDELKIENSLPSGTHIKNCKLKIVNIPHYSLAEQTKLPGIIAKEKLDLMHFLNVNYPVRYKGKFIVTIHDLTLFFYPQTAKDTNFFKQSAYKYTMKKACQNSAKIIAVSENTKKDIIKKFKVKSEKVKVIYEAADDKAFACHPELAALRHAGSPANAGSRTSREILRLTPQDDKPVILYVGQYREHKNVKGLLAAYKILKKEIDCRLILVGNMPETYMNIIDNDPDLRDTVAPGFVSDEELASWYNTASVFVFPSFYEGFGLPGLEAMQAGTPVVASKTSSLPEIYKDAAVYFDPNKPHDIADKIKLVLQDKQLASNLIIEGKKVAASYSWRKTASETLEIYKQVI